MAGAQYLAETEWGRTKQAADLIAAMFEKTNGEVFIDLQAERREQRKIM